MRFVITGEWSRNRLLRLILLLFLVYTTLLWVTNLLLYFQKMGLTYQSVVDYYLGNEERFTQPRSFQGMVEVAHFHLFAMGMLVMTLTHLLLFIPTSLKLKGSLILATFFSAIGDEAAGWGVRFVHPSFAYAKIGFFVLLQASLLLLIILLFLGTTGRLRNAYMDSADKRSRSLEGQKD